MKRLERREGEEAAPVAGRDGVGEEGMVVDLDAQRSVLLDGTDEVEEDGLRRVVCGGYQDRSLSAEPDWRDSITVIGWVEEAVLAQAPGGLDGNTGRGHDAPGREGVEAEDGIGEVQVWKQGRLNRAGECPEGLVGADERDVGFSLPEMGIQGIGVFPEAATDDDGSRRQFARGAIERDEAGSAAGGTRRRSKSDGMVGSAVS